LMCWTRNSTLSSQKISCRDRLVPQQCDQMFWSCTRGRITLMPCCTDPERPLRGGAPTVTIT
jgi:hypothetical protein